MNRVFDQALMAYNKETKKLDDLYRSAAKNCGMAECAFWILYTLRVEEKSFTQAEICEFLVEPKQTVNSALKKLVAEGYLAPGQGCRAAEDHADGADQQGPEQHERDP